MADRLWRPEDNHDVDALANTLHQSELSEDIYQPEVLKTIENVIDGFSDKLRALSLDIHEHPELKWEEHRTHDVLTSFMENHGFEVTRHYLIDTAWRATYTHGSGGRTLGVNSEMDALPGIGHACGHNLIAMAGVAVALAAKAALEKHKIDGKIILLGTPAEEGGSGKVHLIDKGAYEPMDICVMCHPAPGPRSSVSLSSSLAVQRVNVEYEGHTAHAALSPWEGQNALDAAVLAYNSVSVLRQQIRPTHRVHGIMTGKDWTPNIIPDYCKMTYLVRAPYWSEAKETFARVLKCFEAGATATACSYVTTRDPYPMYELRQNKGLGDELAHVIKSRFGYIDYEWGIAGASTDFGNVTYVLPALHPGFAIPTVPGGGNHTREFAQAAATMEAHKITLIVSKGLAHVGMRVLTDDKFFEHVKKTFEEDKAIRGEID